LVDSSRGGSAPSGSGYTKIYSTENAFVAIKTDGSITAWGQNYGGTGAAPSTGTYTKIYTTAHAFAALKAVGIPVATAVNVAGAGFVDDVAKLTVSVSV
jgi:hypothetical protein